MLNDNDLSTLFYLYFFTILLLLIRGMNSTENFISEIYLYLTAQNVGYLKRFAGL